MRMSAPYALYMMGRLDAAIRAAQDALYVAKDLLVPAEYHCMEQQMRRLVNQVCCAA